MGGGFDLEAIVAMTPDRVIGKGNELPWHLPEDLKQFKARTTGHSIVMGRRTFDSIGRALPNRRNIVLTRQKLEIPDVDIIHSLEDLNSLELEGKVFLIGGAEVYRLGLNHCKGIYLTQLKQEYLGDVRFPEFRETFVKAEELFENDDFTVSYWRNNSEK